MNDKKNDVSKGRSLFEKVLKWFTFSVLAALLPFVCNWLSLLTQAKMTSMEILFSRGELLLVSCAISAAALGELIGSGRKYFIGKIIVGFCCSAVLMLNSYWFSQISLFILRSEEYNKMFVTDGSLIIFIISLFAAISSILTSEA